MDNQHIHHRQQVNQAYPLPQEGIFYTPNQKENPMRKITTEPTYQGHAIMTDKERNLACDTNILDAIKDQFEYATQHNSKTFFMRYDLRFPTGEQEHTDNKLVRDFQANFIKHLKRDGLNPQYVLVREQSREKHQHYHGLLLLNGQKIQHVHHPIEVAEKLWRSALDLPEGNGLVDACMKTRDGKSQVNGVMLRKDDPDYETQKDECFRRASYLAKVNQKENTPKGQRELFSSRLPKMRDK